VKIIENIYIETSQEIKENFLNGKGIFFMKPGQNYNHPKKGDMINWKNSIAGSCRIEPEWVFVQTLIAQNTI